jgi:manganese transport protein
MALIRAGLDVTRTLVVSQVALSVALPFATGPLAAFTARRRIIRNLVNRLPATIIASIIAALVVALNLFLVYRTFVQGSQACSTTS